MLKKPNRLIYEKSPYLLQHADNPVDWYPWCEEAFEKARKENKPIFLSIGYSTCHWCHVMEKESFEDEEVAKLLNDTFVCIKVDREERPDLDAIYMTVCQMLTGSGGWPLTIMMTWEKLPFFAATYLPKVSFGNVTGLLDLTRAIKFYWENKREELINSSRKIKHLLIQNFSYEKRQEPTINVLNLAYKQLASQFDQNFGGFGNAPKFPSLHQLSFLLRYYKRTGNKMALEMVEKTIISIRKGGIYDQLGGGIHRYATDRQWNIPHFEKMLYDQALFVISCSEVYLATKKDIYREIVKDVLSYVFRDLYDGGCYFCGEDADSEGEEGKYYLWGYEELKNTLDDESFSLFKEFFPVTEAGNFLDEIKGKTTGKNVLFLKEDMLFEIYENPEKRQSFDKIREILLVKRSKRIRPGKDKKVLTDWNSLLVVSFLYAYQITQESSYLERAKETVHFIEKHLKDEGGRLLHSFCDGEAKIYGFLEDYAFFVWALIELHQKTQEKNWLLQAKHYNDQIVELFYDKETGGFFHSSTMHRDVPIRKKDAYDGAIPSGNSIEMLNLFRLSRLLNDAVLFNLGLDVAKVFSGIINEIPTGFTQFLCGIDFMIGPTIEVVIVKGNDSEEYKEVIKLLHSKFSPELTIKTVFEGEDGYKTIDEKTTLYFCKGFQCVEPLSGITNIEKMLL